MSFKSLLQQKIKKTMTKPEARLVYSSDPEMNKKCPKCKELLVECSCSKDENVDFFKGPVGLRLEKQGRGGKTVTVVDRFPKNEGYLKNLTAILKKKCGSGGTYTLDGKNGVIEIQGDKRDLLRSLLDRMGLQVRG